MTDALYDPVLRTSQSLKHMVSRSRWGDKPNLRLPPYSNQIRNALSTGDLREYRGTSPDGKRATIWLFCGSEAWSQCKRMIERNALATLLPPDEPANAFDWSVLTGHDPLLLVRAGEVDPAVVDELVLMVLKAGATDVLEVGRIQRWVREVRQ